jgi:hypothetical protein
MSGDFTRCHDAACPQRHQCRRWLERDAGWEKTSHVATLRVLKGDCQFFLDAEKSATPAAE